MFKKLGSKIKAIAETEVTVGQAALVCANLVLLTMVLAKNDLFFLPRKTWYTTNHYHAPHDMGPLKI